MQESSHLPDPVIRQIAAYIVKADSPGIALINLMSMCGVCRHWRSVAREMDVGVCVAFDGLDNSFTSQATTALHQKFRKLNTESKELFFVCAARLFTGYSEATFSGEAVTDLLLSQVASRSGGRLRKIKIQSTSQITDAGLAALVAVSPQLQEFQLEQNNKGVVGSFITPLFETCRDLHSVHLDELATFNWGSAKVSSPLWSVLSLRKLHVRGITLDADFACLMSKFSELQELEIDGAPRYLRLAAVHCPKLQRVSYLVKERSQLDDALGALVGVPKLTQLEVIVKNMSLTCEQLRQIGLLPIEELKLDSFMYKQQPTLTRSSYSHIDNEGVKALVDAVCQRWSNPVSGDMRPLKLSLCGATALTHDAVSALLRLPILTELDIGGCVRISAMDKMRLVAKVRAGREMLESGRRPVRSTRFPGLFL